MVERIDEGVKMLEDTIPRLNEEDIVARVHYEGPLESAKVSVSYQGIRPFRKKEYRDYKIDLGWLIHKSYRGKVDKTGYYGIRAMFRTGNKDADNVLKPLMDCAKGIVWKDDRQVKEAYVRVEDRLGRPQELEAVIYKLTTGGKDD